METIRKIMPIIIMVLVVVAITSLRAVFSKIFPIQENTRIDVNDKALINRYQKWQFLELLLFFVFAPFFKFILWKLLVLISPLFKPNVKSAIYIFTHPHFTWLIPAMFSSIVFAGGTIELIERAILKEKRLDLLYFEEARYGFDIIKVTKVMILIFIIAVAGCVFLISNNYLIIEKDGLRLNRFFSVVEERYRYAQIDKIISAPYFIAPNGDKVERREYVVNLKNGKKFNSLYIPGLEEDEQDEFFINFSELTGLTIEEKECLMKEEVY